MSICLTCLYPKLISPQKKKFKFKLKLGVLPLEPKEAILGTHISPFCQIDKTGVYRQIIRKIVNFIWATFRANQEMYESL